MALEDMNVAETLLELSKRKNNIACDGKAGLIRVLTGLHFTCTSGSTPGHRVITHSKLRAHGFITSSLDCGHKPNRAMKLCYITRMIKLIETHKVALQEIQDTYGEGHV